MHTQKFHVEPLLAPYIDSIWAFETETSPSPDDIRTIVASPKLKLIIPYNGTTSGLVNHRIVEHAQASITLVGIMEKPVVLDRSSRLGTLGIEFKPGTAYRFLACPLKDLMNAVYPLEAVLGKIAYDLRQQIEDAPAVEEKARLVQAFLLIQFNAVAKENRLVDYAITMIQASYGLIRINDLCKELGYSKQYLDRQFGEYIGLSPKKLARIVRFQEVYARLLVQPTTDRFQDHISEFFYDQAHFIKEFKRFTGYSPLSYAQQINEFARIFD